MIMPLADDNSGRVRFPFVNYAFIAINVVVFVFLQGFGENHAFTFAFSTVPREIVTGEDLETPDRKVTDPISGQELTLPGLKRTPIPVYLTLLTSMFMHGGIMHLLGNMLFLWIFGDNIEDALGHVRYVFFYLLCGVLAGLAHVATVVVLAGSDSEGAFIPCLGASGAISAVLGGYILLFPHRRVLVLLLRVLVWVPAWVAIGIWFGFQLINSLGMLGAGSQQSGVAYAAHIGGFIAGVILTPIFAIGDPWRDRDSRWPALPKQKR